VPWLAKRRLLATPRIDFQHPAVRRILGLMAPVVVGQSATHVGTVINTIIASFLVKGSVSYLYYADRLIEFPLGVIAGAIATTGPPPVAGDPFVLPTTGYVRQSAGRGGPLRPVRADRSRPLRARPLRSGGDD